LCEELHIRGSLSNVMFHKGSGLWVEGNHGVGGGECGTPQADFLETRFGLSPAEARLVALLFAGASLRSSATALGIKYETVRSYLKSAFQKTGTHRQAELVLRVFQAMSDSNPPVPAAIAAQGLRTTVENGRGTPIYPHLGAMSNKGGTHN
jgi:DNA-binding CsgD family transcriptional regulator